MDIVDPILPQEVLPLFTLDSSISSTLLFLEVQYESSLFDPVFLPEKT